MDRQERFTAAEAAEFLRGNRSTIYRMARARQVRCHALPITAGLLSADYDEGGTFSADWGRGGRADSGNGNVLARLQ